MTARAWERALDHDELLIEEGQASLDAYESSVVAHEAVEPLEKCPLCERTIWPDDPTSMIQLSSDEEEQECHRLCGLELRVTTLEKKLSALAGRVPV